MTKEQGIVWMQAQIVSAYAEIESMKAANAEREHRGAALAYNEAAFAEVPKRYGLGHNEVISYFDQWRFE